MRLIARNEICPRVTVDGFRWMQGEAEAGAAALAIHGSAAFGLLSIEAECIRDIHEHFAPASNDALRRMKSSLQSYYASRMAVTPMPPAVQTETSPRPPPLSFRSFAIVEMTRAPVAANGWPIAILPPFTFSFVRSIGPSG